MNAIDYINQKLPNLLRVELHITYACNLHCDDCHTLVKYAPSHDILTLDNIRRFIADTIATDWKWERICLHGGEPTLHSDYEAICRLLKPLKKRGASLWVVTNGYGRHNKDKIKYAVDNCGFENCSSEKTGESEILPWHTPLLVSPEDLSVSWSKGCAQAWGCGIALNSRGYYPCSAMAAAARLFGYQPVATRLSQVTLERMVSAFEKHCRHCGHAMNQKDKNPTLRYTRTWVNAILSYAKRNK